MMYSARRVPALALLVLWLSACAPLSQQLKELHSATKYGEVVVEGQGWLNEHRSEQLDADDAIERDKILRWVALARLALARRDDSVDSYQKFQKTVAGVEALADLAEEAAVHEAKAFYRDVTVAANTAGAHQYYRATYANGPDHADSRRRESGLVLAAAMEEGTRRALQSFRAEYHGWEEAAEDVGASRVHEVELAALEAQGVDRADKYRWFLAAYGGWPEAQGRFPEMRRAVVTAAEREAVAAGTVDALAAFRDSYDTWPEAANAIARLRVLEVEQAKAATLEDGDVAAMKGFRAAYADWAEATAAIAAVYDIEADLAYRTARRSATIPALEAFLAEYATEPWIERGEKAIADIALTPVTRPLSKGRLPEWRAVEALLNTTILERPTVRAALDDVAPKAWKLVQGSSDPLHYRMVHRLWPDGPHAPRARRLERDAAWSVVEKDNESSVYEWFFETYPDDKRADLAEERFFKRRRIARATTAWPRANITRRRTLPNGTIELAFDVRDCHGERVGGLGREAFQVFAADDDLEVVGFEGLEADRPLDIVFNIDLSGSMATEQDAVRAAIVRFAETMRFRGRQTRFGLVTFGDELVHIKPPSERLADFERWMSEIRADRGGAHEDSVHAMARTTTFGWGRKAERVVLVFTDERLQTNLGGMAALGITKGGECAQSAKGARCVQKCLTQRSGNQRLGCLERCVSYLPNTAKQWYRRCRTNSSSRVCLGKANWAGVARAAERCSGEISPGDSVITTLAAKLSAKAVRPIFFIPDNPNNKPMVAFRDLAARAGGQIMPVPEDSRASAPYEQALLEVADQLSKQYVVRVKPRQKRKAGQSPLLIAVTHGHVWREASPLPAGDTVGMVLTKIGSTCPEVTLATSNGAVWASAQCGAKWSPVETPGNVRGLISLTAGHELGSLVALTTSGQVLYGQGHGAPLRYDEEAPGDVRAAVVDATGARWLSVEQDPGNHMLLRRGADEATYSRLSACPASASPQLVFGEASGMRACVLTSATELRCGSPGEADWSAGTYRVTGLTPAALQPGAHLFPVSHREGVWLLAAMDGNVYRSRDGGRSWTRTLKGPRGPTGAPALATVPGKPPLVCASSYASVSCSEDSGRSWTVVGHPYDQQAIARVVASDGHLVLAQGGHLSSLERLVSRDIPSDNVYFRTNKHEPTVAMLPFLKALARTLRQHPNTTLRVEGHADRRGSTEHNEDLARRRAEAVVANIQREGIDRSRIEAVSFGERRPLSTPNLARHRRVELLVLRPLPRGGWQNDDCARR